MSLEEMIRDCLLVVQNDQQHDLRLGLRRRLWCSLDGVGIDRNTASGHRRRIRLSVLAVEKVLPLWESAFPADRTPHHALNVIEELLTGNITSAAAEKEVDRLELHFEDEVLGKQEGNQSVEMVGFAAIRALQGALWDEVFGCDKLNDQLVDLDIDTYDSESSWFAAVAYSGGATWETDSDPQKRLEFWTWWLTSAVRAAALAAPHTL